MQYIVCLFLHCCWKSNYQKRGWDWIPLAVIYNTAHCCGCPKPTHIFSITYTVILFVSYVIMWEVVVCVVNIEGIVNHRCLNFRPITRTSVQAPKTTNSNANELVTISVFTKIHINENNRNHSVSVMYIQSFWSGISNVWKIKIVKFWIFHVQRQFVWCQNILQGYYNCEFRETSWWLQQQCYASSLVIMAYLILDTSANANYNSRSIQFGRTQRTSNIHDEELQIHVVIKR